MEILLIGNGFDLEHGLPTKYSDFLEFCKVIQQFSHFYNSPNEHITPALFREAVCNDWNTADSIKTSIMEIYTCKFERLKVKTASSTCQIPVSSLESALDEVYSLIHNNIWFRFFVQRVDKMGTNWIDLESEISNVIHELDTARTPSMRGLIHTPPLFNEIVDVADMYQPSDIIGNRQLISHFTSCLIQHLSFFIRALEIYIASFINAIPSPATSPDIANLNPDHVLSFNYSNTFERLYGSALKIEYDYIHGKAFTSSTIDSCNLVLGIDEYLDDSKKNTDLDFIFFKKFYQRILKSTGSTYQEWLGSIKKDYSDTITKRNSYESKHTPGPFGIRVDADFYYPISIHNLYIFGHSLDVTDGDVLKSLICNDNVHTHIFYYREYEHDKRTLGKLIQNLVRIIGQDELIRRTGGSHKTIEFIPQTLHE